MILVSYVFKATSEPLVKEGKLIVAIAGGSSPHLIFIDPKSLEHFERDLGAHGKIE